MTASVDKISDNAIIILVGIPIIVTAVLVVIAVMYTRRKERQLMAILELPRSQRSGLESASQTKKSLRVDLDVI